MEDTDLKLQPISIHEKAYLYFPSEQQQLTQKGQKGRRYYYFGNIKHSIYQKQKLKQFKQYVNEHKIEYNKQIFNDKTLLLFYQGQGYKIQNTLNALKQYLEFKIKYLPPDFKIAEKLIVFYILMKNKGFFYPCGRDMNFRPILVFNVKLFDLQDRQETFVTTNFVHEIVIEKMILPGQVENWIVIFDLGGMGISQIPMSTIKEIITRIGRNYRGRLYKMYVVNAPNTVYYGWKIVKPFLDDFTVQKINVFSQNTSQALFENIHPSQLQQKYGGTQYNKTVYWPFLMPKAVYDESKLISIGRYKDRLAKGKLKQCKINPKYANKM